MILDRLNLKRLGELAEPNMVKFNLNFTHP